MLAAIAIPNADFPELLAQNIIAHKSNAILDILPKTGGIECFGLLGFDRASLALIIEHAPFQTLWHPAFGTLELALKEQSQGKIQRLIAAVALRLTECGSTPDWTLELDQPESFLFADKVLLDVVCFQYKEIENRMFLTLVTPSGKRQNLIFVRKLEGWRCETRVQTAGNPFYDVMGGVLPEVAKKTVGFADGHKGNDLQDGSKFLSKLNEARSIINDVESGYAEWTSRIVNYFFVMSENRIGLKNSGSSKYASGVVMLTNSSNPIDIAEMIVHESAHQYLYITTKAFSLVNDVDSRLYYSPFRNENRPLGAIFSTYHAFSIVKNFYVSLHKIGRRDDSEVRDIIVSIDTKLRLLEPVLQQSDALTVHGMEFLSPLLAENDLEHAK